MKILWLAPYPFFEHQHPATWIVELAKLLVTDGNIDLTILSTASNMPSEVVSRNVNGYKVIHLATTSVRMEVLTLYTKRIKLISDWVKSHENEYDLIHVHGTENQYETAALVARIPKIVSIQGLLHKYIKFLPEPYSKRKLIFALGAYYERSGIRSNVSFIGRTDWDKDAIMDINPRATYYKIWEAIRTPFFSVTKAAKPSMELLFIGGSNDIKGIKEVLMTLDNLLLTCPGCTLRIAGNVDGAIFQNLLRKHTRNIKASSHIKLLGMLGGDALAKEMSQAFVLLHPSWIDNSPNSVCEAQVIGLPVVARPVGGVVSLIEHEKTGMFSSPDPVELTKNVLRLKNEPELYNRISAESRRQARDRHDAKRILNETIAAYKEIVRT